MSLLVPPYPPARYTEDEPEVSASLRRADAPADYDSFGLVQYHYLTIKRRPAATTGCTASASRRTPADQARTSTAPWLYDGRDWIDGHQSDFLFVPPGGVHGFRNEADKSASILMLFAPGAPREHYFEGLAQLGDLTDQQRRAWFDANDNFFPE